ncbi:hypothetical protein ABVT39_012820 [Epinephelus coioides]
MASVPRGGKTTHSNPRNNPNPRGSVDEENYEAEDKEKLGRAQQPGARTKDRTVQVRYETSEEEEVVIKGMRGEEEDEAMHPDIVAATEAESDSVLANFGTEDLAKVLDKCILESRYKEDELEQYSRKENVRINGIEETDEETEDQLVEKVCQLAAAAGTTVTEKDISTAHRLGGTEKQGKTIFTRC